MYNVNASNPADEPISLLSEKAEPKIAPALSFNLQNASIPAISTAQGINLDGSKTGIQIEIGTKNSKNGAKIPRMASTMKIHPGKSFLINFIQIFM